MINNLTIVYRCITFLLSLRLLIDIKGNTAAETQRHIKKNLSSLYWLFFFTCVSLRYAYVYLRVYKTEKSALGAQWNNISFREMEHLKLKSNYVLASVVPSGLFSSYPHFKIYSRKGTG
jgi:hypothetical protein